MSLSQELIILFMFLSLSFEGCLGILRNSWFLGIFDNNFSYSVTQLFSFLQGSCREQTSFNYKDAQFVTPFFQ